MKRKNQNKTKNTNRNTKQNTHFENSSWGNRLLYLNAKSIRTDSSDITPVSAPNIQDACSSLSGRLAILQEALGRYGIKECR